MTDLDDSGRRVHHRVRLALQVSYRSTGSFLLSYSVNLSRGGLYIESDNPSPVGTELELELDVPGVEERIRLNGVVVWRRETWDRDLPPGMGIEFRNVEKFCGALIDQLVRHFSGVRVLVASPTPRIQSQLIRLLRTSLACEVEEHSLDGDPPQDFERPFDLLVVDLGEADPRALALMQALKRGGHPTAVVALSDNPRVRQEALEAGADHVLQSPPALTDLRAGVLRALARPMVLQREVMED